MKKWLVMFMMGLLFGVPSFGQVYANIDLKTRAEEEKKDEYPYLLPIWGAKAAKLGFQLPYSAGINFNYFGQESDIIIENLQVGFNNGPMLGLGEVVRFDKAVAAANSINIRPDIWVFPFLNVYGIFGKAKTSTTIEAGLWLPDAGNDWTQRVAFSSKANFDATSVGFGLTPTIGVGKAWFALDMNFVWTDVSALNKPVFTFVFGPRLGKTFKFKNPSSNIAFWVGAFRVKLSSSTAGSLSLSEVLPLDGLQDRVDQGLENVSNAQTQIDAWWDGLSMAEKLDPVNIAKHTAADRAIDTAGNLLTAMDGALSNAGTATVQYSLEKRPKDMWNLLVGSQLQINRHVMLRGEVGFLGSRTQVVLGLQYRFGL